jgi:hypothetical protein
MVKITRSVSIEIEKDGQKISLSPDEIEDIKRQLDAAIREKAGESFVKHKGKQQKGKASSSSSPQQIVYHISDEKKKAIINNVNKQLSETPKTLSSLLNGVTYVPNYLPMIRKMVEDQQNVAKTQVGKRTLYFLKDSKKATVKV